MSMNFLQQQEKELCERSMQEIEAQNLPKVEVKVDPAVINEGLQELFRSGFEQEKQYCKYNHAISEVGVAHSVVKRLSKPQRRASANTFFAEHGLVDNAGKQICDFNIFDIQLFEDVTDTSKQQIHFEVELKSGKRHTMTMSVDEFRKGRWYEQLAGTKCADVKLFAEYTESLCANLKDATVLYTEKSGWVMFGDEKKLFYVTDSGEITGQIPNVKARTAGAEIIKSDSLTELQVGQKFWHMRNLTKSITAQIMMIFTVLGSLYTFFRESVGAPKFLMVLVGKASTGKTSLALAICNLYQRMKCTEPAVSLRSSVRSIEEMLDNFNDSVMVVDDLYPAENQRQRRILEDTVEKITRMFGDASSRKRSVNSSYQNYDPKGVALITGEYFTGGLSSLTRCMILSLSETDVDFDVLTRYQQEDKAIPSNFMWFFIGYCTQKQHEIKNFIEKSINTCRKQYQAIYEKPRTTEIHSYLETAADILFTYLTDVGAISNDEYKENKRKISQAIFQILKQNEAQQNLCDPIQLIIKATQTLWEEQPDLFFDISNSEVEKSSYYYDSEYLYAHPQTFLANINSCLAAYGMTTAIDTDSRLRSVLEQNDFLVISKEGNNNRRGVRKTRIRKCGDNRRFFQLYRKKLGI